MFCKKSDTWEEVIIDKGTIQLRDSLWNYSDSANSSYIGWDNSAWDFGQFDRVPHTELRNILNTIKDTIFINISH